MLFSGMFLLYTVSKTAIYLMKKNLIIFFDISLIFRIMCSFLQTKFTIFSVILDMPELSV